MPQLLTSTWIMGIVLLLLTMFRTITVPSPPNGVTLSKIVRWPCAPGEGLTDLGEEKVGLVYRAHSRRDGAPHLHAGLDHICWGHHCCCDATCNGTSHQRWGKPHLSVVAAACRRSTSIFGPFLNRLIALSKPSANQAVCVCVHACVRVCVRVCGRDQRAREQRQGELAGGIADRFRRGWKLPAPGPAPATISWGNVVLAANNKASICQQHNANRSQEQLVHRPREEKSSRSFLLSAGWRVF